ncbi:ATP-binding cassette domain-containing protein [bacterium]|nr:ATP-binding cassette domain-containing protein [bacterium]
MSALLQIKNLSKAYGNQVVLNRVSFSVGEKQRIGVIGRNGAGKSTLIKIITGYETADQGEFNLGVNTRLGYLRQEDSFLDTEKVIDYLLRISKKEEWQCAKIASRFCLKEKELSSKILSLSGGYQMRVKLSAMLLQEPNLLLLDEPTNYLDMSTMLLLEDFLNDYQGAFMIISHDREFLENVCQETLEIENSKTYYFPGNLSRYEKFKDDKLSTAKKFNKKQDAKEKHLQEFVTRFRSKASKASQAQSKIKAISKIERIEILKKPDDVYIKIPSVEIKKGLALRMEDLIIGYGDKAIADEISIDINRGEHIAVLGDNGEGKSTFLKTLAEELDYLGGSLRWMQNTKVAYYAQHVSVNMNNKDTVETYLNYSAGNNQSNEDIMRMASNFLFRNDDLKKVISMLSGGEKARLCLAGILLNENNVLLLDEPNNHLDFKTVEALGRALQETYATILFISHDRTFVNMLADSIIEVKQGKVKRFMGDYDEYIISLRARASLKNVVKKNNDRIFDKAIKKQIFFNLKESKKKISKLDKLIKEKTLRKQNILDKFSKDPTKYSQELYEELGILEKELLEYEQDWLKAHELMEG